MTDKVQFETPENIVVSYDLAGLGTRFVAWMTDVLLMFAVVVVILFATVFTIGFAGTDIPTGGYAVGMAVVVLGFLPIAYFALFELFMRGQTLGKRTARLRVVSVEGFSLTPTAVILRNVFRVIDSVPLFWVVPFVSSRAQRFGDMVAGTVVIAEKPPVVDSLQVRLLERAPEVAQFRFTPAQLSRLQEQEFLAVERYIERRSSLSPEESALLAGRLANALAVRLDFEPIPGPTDQDRFLEDLLAAHLRRQVGELG